MIRAEEQGGISKETGIWREKLTVITGRILK
jgi:hypothetical protein